MPTATHSSSQCGIYNTPQGPTALRSPFIRFKVACLSWRPLFKASLRACIPSCELHVGREHCALRIAPPCMPCSQHWLGMQQMLNKCTLNEWGWGEQRVLPSLEDGKVSLCTARPDSRP